MSFYPSNWRDALSTVFASLVGTLGVILLISFVLSLESRDMNTTQSFLQYFQNGQIGLSVLSISGAIFIAIRGHPQTNQLVSWGFYVFFVLPVIATAIIVGRNPGFHEGKLEPETVALLWTIYFLLHALWFAVVAYEKRPLSPLQHAEKQQGRVSTIEERAASDGQ